MNADDDFLRERVPPPQQQPRPWAPPPQQPPPPPQPAPYLQPGPMTRPQPTRGWRRVVLSATLGLVNLGPSPAEREEATYLAAIRSLPNGSYKVGVLGKGGVGKTTVAASVGSVFAALRRADHVVAVDADTAFGRLGSRIDPHATSSYWDLAADQSMQSFTDISSRVGANAAGLYVLVGEPAAGKRRILDAALYREAALRLDRHFTISIIDCGSTMDSPVTQEALRDLDALIVVSSPWADGAGAAAKTMEWLADRGQGGLLQRTVVVLNDSDGHADKRTRSALTAQFLRHGQAVVEVPFDPHLRPGGVIDVMSEMTPGARRRFLQIAAIVAHYFASRPRGRDAKPGRSQST
ncbi:MinD/ParA family ATP-binding protein [Mycolicibacter arupensis]|nr:MinD/ParA family protein [Mycolicibacter arupensis]MCV7274630.1 MinD/ParA family protein [Mycolicibacter arupensis]